MPWKASSIVNERMKFATRLEMGEKMTDLCREFGISRPTGYKFWNRYLEEGPEGLRDQCRRPKSHPATTDIEIEKIILKTKSEKPSWGAPKIKEILERRYSDIKIPARSTIHVILDRNGLVKKRGRKRKPG
jgi:transposase